MQAGDQVVYVGDPVLYGLGTIEKVLGNGRLLVAFVHGFEQFNPDELELLSVWQERERAAA